METRDALLLLALLGAGAYAAHANWDTIRTKLSFDDLDPEKLRAVKLCQDAYSFAPPDPNWIVLRDRAKNGEIKVPENAWRATTIQHPRYRVTCTWLESGSPCVHAFTVDLGKCSVNYEGVQEATPAAASR